MKQAPCKDCERRTDRCHSTCEDYIAFRKERDEYIRSRNEQQRAERAADSYLYDKAFGLKKKYKH